jgi:hypothetical protein
MILAASILGAEYQAGFLPLIEVPVIGVSGYVIGADYLGGFLPFTATPASPATGVSGHILGADYLGGFLPFITVTPPGPSPINVWFVIYRGTRWDAVKRKKHWKAIAT